MITDLALEVDEYSPPVIDDNRIEDVDPAVLEPYAARYIWWQQSHEAVKYPLRVVAQVMDIGAWDDVISLSGKIGWGPFRQALMAAEAGQLSPKSWHFWHYRLAGCQEESEIPPLPQRRFE